MFDIIDKESTEGLLGHRSKKCRAGGMTDILRKQFCDMKVGESFIFPDTEERSGRKLTSAIRGSCHAMNVKVRTLLTEGGVIVVYEGRK